MDKSRPLIFEIKRHALVDGPGIRTTVFFKGCQLRCSWCQNPESIEVEAEIGFYADDCIGCGDCVEACPRGAVSLDNPDRIHRRLCDRCGECVKACPGLGLRFIGKYYPVRELTAKLLRDKVFYEVSGGGVTLSGGEPTIHLDYFSGLLKALKKRGIHLTLQTNGFFDWREFAEKVLDYLDLIMIDVKLAHPDEHRQFTGRKNAPILKNLTRLVKTRREAVLPRIPLIPGITTTTRNLRAISLLLQNIGVTRCSLLPYNPLGFSKAEHLGKSVSAQLSRRFMSPAEVQRCKDIFSWAEIIAD
jgi:pyruvate formate lyase activating enzyme